MRRTPPTLRRGAALLVAATMLAGCTASHPGANRHPSTTESDAGGVEAAPELRVASDARVDATLDDRYVSYNVEMVTVTGGSFWAPYGAANSKAERPPIDLGSARLRNLTRALGPAYLRVSGTWANQVYFDPNGRPGETAPDGFNGVLTGDEWRGVGAFADFVGDKISTSYPSVAAVRGADGAWIPDQTIERMRFDRANHIPVAAAELFNEANLPVTFPPGYTATDFIRDFDTFAKVAKTEAPDLKLVGPSAANDKNPILLPASIKASDMLAGMGSKLDVFSYHFYPKSSQRCGGKGTAATGLRSSYLDAIRPVAAYYRTLRDTYAPHKPIWVTETAQAQCGGDPWASKFVDVIRFVDTLGTLATDDGNVVFHNTLVGSDYALLSEDGFVTHPDYWAAVLWHRLMGPEVLTPPKPDHDSTLRVFAQCTAGTGAKGVTYAVLDTSPTKADRVRIGSTSATVYQLTGQALDSPEIALNGTTLRAHADGTLPSLPGRQVTGSVRLPPASVTFVVDPTPVAACRG